MIGVIAVYQQYYFTIFLAKENYGCRKAHNNPFLIPSSIISRKRKIASLL